MERNNENEPHPDYVQGFNEGYFLANEMPQFASDIGKYMPDSERGHGFNKGVEQYTQELTRERQEYYKEAFKDNKGDIGVDNNSRDNLNKGFKEMKADMGINKGDRVTGWLTEKDENKSDMGLDRDYDIQKDDKEPELD
jgi:hypothetical protein